MTKHERTGARKRETVRVTFHLDARTVERLGVHCALVHRNNSAVVGEILEKFLARWGRGRELFPAEAGEDLLSVPDTTEDRQSETAA